MTLGLAEVTEWRCDECRGRVIRGQAATRYGQIVCANCVTRGVVPHLTPIKWAGGNGEVTPGGKDDEQAL